MNLKKNLCSCVVFLATFLFHTTLCQAVTCTEAQIKSGVNQWYNEVVQGAALRELIAKTMENVKEQKIKEEAEIKSAFLNAISLSFKGYLDRVPSDFNCELKIPNLDNINAEFAVSEDASVLTMTGAFTGLFALSLGTGAWLAVSGTSSFMIWWLGGAAAVAATGATGFWTLGAGFVLGGAGAGYLYWKASKKEEKLINDLTKNIREELKKNRAQLTARLTSGL